MRAAAKRKRGRPQEISDAFRVTEMAARGLTAREIAACFGVTENLIQNRFSGALRRGEELCNARIRSKQVERALAGSDSMLIWLGKCRLNQTDKVDVNEKLRAAAMVKDERLDYLTDEELKTMYEILYRAEKRKVDGQAPPAPAETPQSADL